MRMSSGTDDYVQQHSLTTDGPANKVAVKFDGQKLRYDLIPVMPLEELAKVYTFGAIKYGDRNWEKGFTWCRCLAAAMRHLFEFCKGEDVDSDSGCHHLSAVAFYCVALIEFGRTHPGLDDRVKLK